MKSLKLRYLVAPLIALLLLIGTRAYAAESTYWVDSEIAPGFHLTKITWVAAAGGTTTAQTINSRSYDGTTMGQYFPDNQSGFLVMAITDPDGTTAPTDNYEILLTDKYSVNMFGTALDALDTANNEDWEPDIAYRPFQFPITFDQEAAGGANAANCGGIIYVFWLEKKQ